MKRFLIVVAVLAACIPAFVVAPASGTATPCSSACAVLAANACVEGAPTEAGTTCTSFCEQQADAGFLPPLPLTCVLEAGSLAGLKSCGVCQ